MVDQRLLEKLTSQVRELKTVEGEILLQDFLELSHVEQMEILLLALCQVSARCDWAVSEIETAKKNGVL
jgi:hypothetical protein